MPSKTIRPKAGVDVRARRKLLRIPDVIARDIGMQIVPGRFKPGEIPHGEIETQRTAAGVA